MNVLEIAIGLAAGVIIGAMDFSLAKSIATVVRSGNVRAIQILMVGGFIVRLGLVGITLWLLSRSGGISFVAVCIGLTGAFTVMTLAHAFKANSAAARIRKQASDRR